MRKTLPGPLQLLTAVVVVVVVIVILLYCTNKFTAVQQYRELYTAVVDFFFFLFPPLANLVLCTPLYVTAHDTFCLPVDPPVINKYSTGSTGICYSYGHRRVTCSLFFLSV